MKVKVFVYATVLAAVCLTCWSAFAAEGVRTAPVVKVNRWETVKVKVTPPLQPLAKRLALLEEVFTGPDALLIGSVYCEPPEPPSKNLVPRDQYAAVNDNRVRVERPDRALAVNRLRTYYNSGNAKSFY